LIRVDGVREQFGLKCDSLILTFLFLQLLTFLEIGLLELGNGMLGTLLVPLWKGGLTR